MLLHPMEEIAQITESFVSLFTSHESIIVVNEVLGSEADRQRAWRTPRSQLC